MYKTFYSLSREPFAKETDPSEAYQGAAFQEALRALEYVKRTRGIGLLIGEPGAGKTFALRAWKESLSPSLYHVVYFPLSTGGVMDFYRGLALGLGKNRNTARWTSSAKSSRRSSDCIMNDGSRRCSFWTRCIWPRMPFYKTSPSCSTLRWIRPTHLS